MITSNLSCMRIDGIVPLEFRSSSDHSNRSHPQSRAEENPRELSKAQTCYDYDCKEKSEKSERSMDENEEENDSELLQFDWLLFN